MTASEADAAARNAAARLTYGANLAPWFLAASPEERYEIVHQIAIGERCFHGYPDQGEGCDVCDPR